MVELVSKELLDADAQATVEHAVCVSDDCVGASLLCASHGRDEKRWSEVVPPDAALGFVAVYDPDEGLMTFSVAELVASSSAPSSPPLHSFPSDEADDGASQVLTIDPLFGMTPPGPGSTTTAMFTFLTENFETKTPIHERYRQAVTRASSISGGIDACNRAAYNHTHDNAGNDSGSSREVGSVQRTFSSKPSRHWSMFSRLNRSFAFDPRAVLDGVTMGQLEDVGIGMEASTMDRAFYGGRQRPRSYTTDNSAVWVELNISSAFSISTSSTSNFIEAYPDEAGSFLPATAPLRRRLRKRRPAVQQQPHSDIDAATNPVATILTRESQERETHVVPEPEPKPKRPASAPASGGRGGLRRIAVCLDRFRPSALDRRWVYVDVKRRISKRLNLRFSRLSPRLF